MSTLQGRCEDEMISGGRHFENSNARAKRSYFHGQDAAIEVPRMQGC